MLFGVIPFEYIGPINMALAALSIAYMVKRAYFTRYDKE